MLIAIVPEPSAALDLGVLTLALPEGVAGREWKAEAVQCSSLVPPESVAASLSRDGRNLNIAVSRHIAEPLALWLTAAE